MGMYMITYININFARDGYLITLNFFTTLQIFTFLI